MFLPGNTARRTILRFRDLLTLLFGHDAIGLRLVFHLFDMFLLIVQPIRFPLIQLAAGNSLVNPFLLVALTLIDAGRLGLGKRRGSYTD